MSTLPNHSHLTPKEIAVFLRVTVQTVYLLCKDDLPHVTWGGVIRIPRQEFLTWYARHSQYIPAKENNL